MALASTVFSKEEVDSMISSCFPTILKDIVTTEHKEIAILALLRDQGLPEGVMPELECNEVGDYTVTLRG